MKQSAARRFFHGIRGTKGEGNCIPYRDMRICFVTSGTLESYAAHPAKADISVLSFRALGEVSYERELKGQTSLFEDVALLSKECGVVIAGCFTDARGMKRKSAVVAEKGRILGVSDMAFRVDGGQYRSGAGVKIYDTGAGKIGVIVGEDLYFPRVAETLSLCGAELAVSVFERQEGSLEQVLMRSYAFLYGMPVCVCAYGYAQAADIGGKLRFATPHSPFVFDYEREQEYHLVEIRHRGLYRKKRSGF